MPGHIGRIRRGVELTGVRRMQICWKRTEQRSYRLPFCESVQNSRTCAKFHQRWEKGMGVSNFLSIFEYAAALCSHIFFLKILARVQNTWSHRFYESRGGRTRNRVPKDRNPGSTTLVAPGVVRPGNFECRILLCTRNPGATTWSHLDKGKFWEVPRS